MFREHITEVVGRFDPIEIHDFAAMASISL